jgi:hypothetical protein
MGPKPVIVSISVIESSVDCDSISIEAFYCVVFHLGGIEGIGIALTPVLSRAFPQYPATI